MIFGVVIFTHNLLLKFVNKNGALIMIKGNQEEASQKLLQHEFKVDQARLNEKEGPSGLEEEGRVAQSTIHIFLSEIILHNPYISSLIQSFTTSQDSGASKIDEEENKLLKKFAIMAAISYSF